MKKLVNRVRRAAILGFAWGGVWVVVGLLPARLLVGEINPEHIAGPLYAGIICGALFAELVGIASGRRRLDELSPSVAATWGAASGACGGVLPFVIGDNGRYQCGWSLLVVALAAMAAAVAVRRRRAGTSMRWAAVTAAAAGLLAGAVPWFLTTDGGFERLLPAFLMAGLAALGAISALASPPLARWLHKQHAAGHLGYGA